MRTKAFMLTVVAMAFGLTAFSQASPVKRTIKVPLEQIPLSIRQAYEKDFGAVPEEGWQALVVTSTDGRKTTSTPMYYSYTRRDGKKKVEVRFTPTGEITGVKGIDTTSHAGGSVRDTSDGTR